MIAEKLISDSIPSVSPGDSASKVLTLMDVFRVSHLPIVSDREYLGVISDKEIFDANDFDASLSTFISDLLLKPHVHPHQHIFEVAAVASSCGGVHRSSSGRGPLISWLNFQVRFVQHPDLFVCTQ